MTGPDPSTLLGLIQNEAKGSTKDLSPPQYIMPQGSGSGGASPFASPLASSQAYGYQIPQPGFVTARAGDGGYGARQAAAVRKANVGRYAAKQTDQAAASVGSGVARAVGSVANWLGGGRR